MEAGYLFETDVLEHFCLKNSKNNLFGEIFCVTL